MPWIFSTLGTLIGHILTCGYPYRAMVYLSLKRDKVMYIVKKLVDKFGLYRKAVVLLYSSNNY